MINILICVLSTLGALAILAAAIGVLRMPDFYLRLSVTVKAATLGVGLFLVCAAILFPDVSVTTKSIAIIFFLVLTAPVAAHLIARTAFRSGVDQWKGTQNEVADEMKKQQDPKKEL
ncbi:MAG: monovalent cation/H(+) antiporter subunit G [Flavobacterium sp.]|nr:monovalent cation/H(+) antiporter subunit G [Flavobacterium sp.]